MSPVPYTGVRDPWAGEGVAGSAHPARGSFMLNRGGPHSFEQQAKQNRSGGTSRPLSGTKLGKKQSFEGSSKLRRDPRRVTLCFFLLRSHTGPLFFTAASGAQPNPCLQRKGGGGSIPPRAGPWKAGASSSLSRPWPAKPGGEARRQAEFSSLRCFSGSCPRRIRPWPKRENSWREATFLILCVSL